MKFKTWFISTWACMLAGLAMFPLVLRGLMSCCSSPSFIETIPAWPVWPFFRIWAEFAEGNNGGFAPFFVACAIGYGMFPTYFLILKLLWKRLWKPCTSS